MTAALVRARYLASTAQASNLQSLVKTADAWKYANNDYFIGPVNMAMDEIETTLKKEVHVATYLSMDVSKVKAKHKDTFATICSRFREVMSEKVDMLNAACATVLSMHAARPENKPEARKGVARKKYAGM